MVILVLPLMFMLNWWLTLLLFVTMPLVSFTVKFFGQQVHTRFEKIQDFFGQITARAQENFSGVRVVRAYAQEDAEMAAFNSLNWQYAERNLGLVKVEALMRPLMTFLIGFGYVLIIWAGVPLAVRGEITVGEFTMFNLYLTRLIWPLIALGYVVNLYQRGTASLKRLNAILQIEPSIADVPGTVAQPPIKGKIEFRNLTFSYHPNDEPVLKNVTLTIPEGHTVAFVGRTGSGKSTIANLIPRLIDAPDDTLFIDDVDIRDYPLAQLRESIGYVPQETFLFSDSVKGNIAFGVVDAKQAEVEWAAEIAGLSEDIAGFPIVSRQWLASAASHCPGSKATHRDCAGSFARAEDPDSGRCFVVSGYLHGREDPRAASWRDARSHERDHLASHFHGTRSGHDLRPGRRPDHRAGNSR